MKFFTIFLSIFISISLFSADPICEANEHIEDALCVLNTKDVDCDINNANPANSEDIVVPVTINWVIDAWEAPALCDFACLADFHLDNLLCESDTQQVSCDEANSNPVNSTDLIVDVDVIWDGSQYSAPELCAWACDDGFTKAGDDCIADDLCSNVTCGDNEECNAGSCVCLTDFHLEETVCVSDTKEVNCDEDNANPVNSTDTVILVNVTWEGAEYSAPELCAWACDSGYILSQDGTSCEETVIDLCENVTCQDNSTCNAGTGDCDCNTGYVLSQDGTSCEEEVVDLCENVTCQANSTCNATTGNCDCNTGYEPSSNGNTCIEIVVDLCEAVVCRSNSTCQASTGKCLCDEGYIWEEIGVTCTRDSDYNRLLKTLTFGGGTYESEAVLENNTLVAIKIKNISTNDIVVTVSWDLDKDENKEKLTLAKGSFIIFEVIPYMVKNEKILNFSKSLYITGEFLFEEKLENYEISNQKYNMQLIGTIAGVDKDGNPFLNRDEENLNSFIKVDLDKDGSFDIKLKVPYNITTDINEVKYDILRKVILYDGKLLLEYDTNPLRPVEEEEDSLNFSLGCSYNNSNRDYSLLLFFAVILIVFRKFYSKKIK